MNDSRNDWIARQAEFHTGEPFSGPAKIFTDTTDYMYIDRGHIIDLEGRLYLVRGNETEGRFGLDEQPKFWVKRAISLKDGKKQILKLVCKESFKIQVGRFEITCSRSGDKEAQVLRLAHGDKRFMQGHSAQDARGNLVRVIDYIRGKDLLSHIHTLRISHEKYFHECFPSLLARTITAARAIQFLNENGLCHGDIRNDHILIEEESGDFRWIDFDLTQDFSGFDLWSLGNILHCVVAKGFLSFRDAVLENPMLSGLLCDEDASSFFPHRIMNLRKVYPYIPDKLNKILLRFSKGAQIFYDSVAQCVEELGDCVQQRGAALS